MKDDRRSGRRSPEPSQKGREALRPIRPRRAPRPLVEMELLGQRPKWTSWLLVEGPQPMAKMAPWPQVESSHLGLGQVEPSTFRSMSSLVGSGEEPLFGSSSPNHTRQDALSTDITDAQRKSILRPLFEPRHRARPSSFIKEGRRPRSLVLPYFNLYKKEALTHFKGPNISYLEPTLKKDKHFSIIFIEDNPNDPKQDRQSRTYDPKRAGFI